MNNPALAADPEFASNVARVQRRERTDEFVQEFFSSLSARSLVALLTKHHLAFAVVNDMSQLSRHPHLRRIMVETARGPVRYPAPAVRWQAEQIRGPVKVPALDADGEKIRKEFSRSRPPDRARP
jgi:crotonobetainyl-CoA:carnitine CoA-transferase CaiB-like acyl-CoA transferase